MAINIKVSESCYRQDKLGARKVHYMPCKINFDGPANFSKFIHVQESDNDVLLASFQGHPIMGKEIKVPEKYVGLILEKSKNFESTDEKKVFATHAFDSFVHWNWDKVPNKNDVLVKALDWIEIAEVVIMSLLHVYILDPYGYI
ncbi:hypothetical protein B566_EDAN001899 [Ephemera danica]|nr:hypothetical protein B566_EDAN001899 [Ephemera danica]